MSIDSGSTESSPEEIEMFMFKYSQIEEEGKELDSELSDSEMSYFLENFPESRNGYAEFFCLLTQHISVDVKPFRIRAFKYEGNFFALVPPDLTRSGILELIRLGEEGKMEGIYLGLDRNTRSILNVLKMFAYVGFCQVSPEIQYRICRDESLIILHMKLD